MCDYQPHQQGIAIKKRLQGSAALFAEQYTHDQLIAGIVDPATGQNIDAVTMIVRDMVQYFAPRVEEDQQIADLEFENIYRHRDEPIEKYVRRYEKARIRQLNEGMQQYSWRHHSIALLRDSGLPEFHLHQLLLEET